MELIEPVQLMIGVSVFLWGIGYLIRSMRFAVQPTLETQLEKLCKKGGDVI